MTANQVLVAIEWDDRADIEGLFARLGDSVLDFEQTTIQVRERDKAVWRIRFDRNLMRNTVAHGHGCAAGFVCHVED